MLNEARLCVFCLLDSPFAFAVSFLAVPSSPLASLGSCVRTEDIFLWALTKVPYVRGAREGKRTTMEGEAMSIQISLNYEAKQLISRKRN
jgi:hypothetical protein